ncbi:methionine--tRNA ligase, cytoplasmic-like [Physella acuta]|uniref:methionine--tRNA ligase, cytoplasmic-like n=1 Tax=Physella acuta TaxID=109671 RepID=UPI0027DBE771|nr:methionine--tRNA ligase, cytoplasmic-like [Physella acuta]
MKLYSDEGNFQTLKVSIAARVTGTASEILALEVKHNENVVPHLCRSKLPVLEIAEGRLLFSANTAAKYLFLKANQVKDEEAEDEILDWESTELLPLVAAYLVSAIGQGKKDPSLITPVTKVLQQLDAKLIKSKYLLGDSLSLGDVCVFSTIFPLLGLKNFEIIEKLPNIQRWCSDVKANQAVQAAVAEVTKGQGHEIFKASLLAQSFPPLPNKDGGECQVKASGAVNSSATSSVSSEDQVPTVKLTQEELDAARKAWKKNPKECVQPKQRKHPILPEANSRNILVSSALPYVNNVPHLGNIIGCVLSADVFSRFARLRNYNVLYVCGTDEYGTATETKAMEEGVTPKEICDKYNKLHTQVYKWFNIDFDFFGRTTTDHQTKIAQDIFWKLYQGDYILKDSVDQLKCIKCDRFLADRFVEGICPLCGFDDARGDQCDGCGKLINAVELKEPKCKICKSSPVIQTSNHLFVDLPKLEPLLRAHLNKVFESGTWTNNAKVITNSWLRDGLKPRCISRDLKWGTPIPLEGYTDKVFYVWFDAPIGYISITANYTAEWEKWWKNSNQIEYYNFLGKDNVPFHSVIFPACLLGTNDNYTVVNHMVATEYLNYEDTKFSKSRNTGVFGDQAETTGIPADVFRFYLLYVRPESQDTAFSWDDFLLKNNSELLNNLGNFINRALMFLNNNFGGVVQPMEENEDDIQLIAQITDQLKGYTTNLDNCRLRDGIRNILNISRLGNQYMQVNKPWVLAKGTEPEKKRAGTVVSVCANVSCLLSVLIQPYMPATSAVIQQQLQAPASVNCITGEFVAMLQPGHKIGQPSPLFQKIEATIIAELKQKFAGSPAEKAPPKKQANKNTPKVEGTAPVASTEEIDRLTKAVADQGNKVREFKAAKAEKSVIEKEVASLLQLKKDLSAAQGPAEPAVDKKSKSKEAGDKKAPVSDNCAKSPASVPNSTPASGGQGDPAVVEKLTQSVTEQGNKVRDLKASKAEKSVIDKEVAILLQLKKDLELAQGKPLQTTAASGSKKGKKKK